MEPLSSPPKKETKKDNIYCTSGHCPNIPEIKYSYNPLKTEFQYKCQCHNNNIYKPNLNLKDFLEKSSQLYCYGCRKKIPNNKIFFCDTCKNFFEEKCVIEHEKDSHIIFENENIFKFCIEHKKNFMFRCTECNKFLCNDCNLSKCDDNGHHLMQLRLLRPNENNISKIKYIFNKQKDLFEKIKNLNNNLMQTLENDIKIKERCINNYLLKNYNSDNNLINLDFNNNEKYEKILDNILSKNIKNENKEITTSDYINNYLSILYYSLMINKEESLNNSIMNELNKKVNNLVNEEKVANNNINKNNNKNQIIDIEGNLSSENNSQNLNNINDSNKENKPSKKLKSLKIEEQKNEVKKDAKEKSKESDINSESDDNSENEINNDEININNRNEIIDNNESAAYNNMIILKSGNIAISKKEVIEIYDLRKLNFQRENCIYNNEEIKNMCLLQKIMIAQRKFINYVFEFTDQTLLCATFSKIYRIKLTNNDLNYELLDFIDIKKENPTKMISLGKDLLVVLTETKKYSKIKLFKKIEKNKKENKEDTSFELIQKNALKDNKLFISIYPIIINKNIRKDDYLYEFIATTNYHFNNATKKCPAMFFGVKKNNIDKYYAEKIKEIDNLSCSIEADSICQISDRYLCLGLQRKNLDGQINGFALIDIYKRDVYNIINTKDDEISSLCYNPKNNLLFASMEICNGKFKSDFRTKIYQLINKVNDKEKRKIELEVIYQYNNKHFDSISSIKQMPITNNNMNLEGEDIDKNIILITYSKDLTLQAIKVEFE